MRGSVRNLRAKERKLIQLYSLWHETHQEAVQKKWISLLGEVLSNDPAFNLRHKFTKAF